MKAAVYYATGGPEVFRYEEVPDPVARPGGLLISVKAISIEGGDTLHRQGGDMTRSPHIVGYQAAGIVREVGDGVDGFGVGQAVVATMPHGSHAEIVSVPVAAAYAVPDGLDIREAACVPIAYGTADDCLFEFGHLKKGESVLIQGAAGGVGLAAVDVGKILGARVIATASSEVKRAFLTSYGADHVLPSSGFRESVKELTGGKGADVVYDPVGGDVFDESVRCIAFNGRLLVIGFTSGRIPTVSVNMPLIKGFSVVGVRAGEYGRQFPERGAENIRIIDAWAAEGKIRPHVCATFPLERANEAMRMLQERKVIGKVVLTM